jgi:hypothetical protein
VPKWIAGFFLLAVAAFVLGFVADFPYPLPAKALFLVFFLLFAVAVIKNLTRKHRPPKPPEE